jgi:outer membrane biosynthesis protein TonB
MAYYSETSPTSRIIGFGFVILLHLALGYALLTGLATTLVEVVKGPIQVKALVEEQKDNTPPPPPPATLKPPPVYVPPVEVNVAPETTSNSTAIQAVTSSHTNPKISANRTVDYPRDAAHLKAEADLIYQVDLDERGHVVNIRFVRFEKLVNSTPQIEAAFQDRALNYIQNELRFSPAKNAGVPVAQSNVPIRVKFHCNDLADGGGRNC